MSEFEKQVLRELRTIRNVLEKMSGERSEMAENVNDPFRNIQDRGSVSLGLMQIKEPTFEARTRRD